MTTDFPQRIRLTEAEALIDVVGARHCLPAIRIDCADALGCVLTESVTAPIDLPVFDNSAMDGYAVCGADLDPARPVRLRLIGEQFAGPSKALSIASGECVRITTGAPMPTGADTVVIRENAVASGALIECRPGTLPGANLRRAGEDVTAGQILLSAGQRLDAAQLGLCAALGLDSVMVEPRARVAVFSSGDELRAAGQPLLAGEIYDSNGPMLAALLASEGIAARRGPVLPDQPQAMLDRLRGAASDSDLLITCGGVSAGDKDHLPALLQQHGRLHFWRVQIKPGMPLLLGELDGTLVLGLPGNPVAVLACFLVLGRRLIDRLEGFAGLRSQHFARLRRAVEKRHERLEFMRGELRSDPDGVLRVMPDDATGSHRLAAASRANALIVLPEVACLLEADTVVPVVPFGTVG